MASHIGIFSANYIWLYLIAKLQSNFFRTIVRFRFIRHPKNKYKNRQKAGSTWKDSKGDEYPVYMAYTGSCFIIRTSKSGDDYRAYLGEEVSEQIRKELSKSDTRRDRHCFKNRTLKQ